MMFRNKGVPPLGTSYLYCITVIFQTDNRMNQWGVVSVFIPSATVIGASDHTRLSADTEIKNTLYLSFVSDVPDSSSQENDPFRRTTNNETVFSSPADSGSAGPDIFAFPHTRGVLGMREMSEHADSAAVARQGTTQDMDGSNTMYHADPLNTEGLTLR